MIPVMDNPVGRYFNKKRTHESVLHPVAGNYSGNGRHLFPEAERAIYQASALRGNHWGYAGSFYCLSLVLKNIPVGIAYAIWSGMDIVLISAIGWLVFKQHLDLAAIAGLALIIAGVLVINIFSSSVSH